MIVTALAEVKGGTSTSGVCSEEGWDLSSQNKKVLEEGGNNPSIFESSVKEVFLKPSHGQDQWLTNILH